MIPDIFSRGLDNFYFRGMDNFPYRGMDNFPFRGLDNFTYRGLDNFHFRELDNFPFRGLDNFPFRGLDNFPYRGMNNFAYRGLDNFPCRGPKDALLETAVSSEIYLFSNLKALQNWNLKTLLFQHPEVVLVWGSKMSTLISTSVSPTLSTENTAVSMERKREVLRYVHEMNMNRSPNPLPEGNLKFPFHMEVSTPLGIKDDILSPGHWEKHKSQYQVEMLKSPSDRAELPKSASANEAVRTVAQNEQYPFVASPSGVHPNFRSPVGVIPNIGSSPAGLCASTPEIIHGVLSSSIRHPDVQAMQSKRRKSSLSELPPVLIKRARYESTSEDGSFSPMTSSSDSVTSPSAFKWPPGGQVLDLSHLSVGEMESLYRENLDLLMRQKLLLKIIELQLFKAKHGSKVYNTQLKHLVQPEVGPDKYAGCLSDWSDASNSPPVRLEDNLNAIYGKKNLTKVFLCP
eukprot:Em0024g270a